jgi:hypothetical protein
MDDCMRIRKLIADFCRKELSGAGRVGDDARLELIEKLIDGLQSSLEDITAIHDALHGGKNARIAIADALKALDRYR